MQIKYITITITSLIPDMAFLSEGTTQLVILELTVSWSQVEEASERKRAKSTELVNCHRQGSRLGASLLKLTVEDLLVTPSAKPTISWALHVPTKGRLSGTALKKQKMSQGDCG